MLLLQKGDTILRVAAEKGQMDIVEILLQRGGDVNASYEVICGSEMFGYSSRVPANMLMCRQNAYNRTVLHWAVCSGKLDIITLLLDPRLDPNLEAKDRVSSNIVVLEQALFVMCFVAYSLVGLLCGSRRKWVA